MTRKTALNQVHHHAGGRMVDFAAWDMPLHYGSQKEEHHIVRKGAGMFDVSHMAVIDFRGEAAHAFLRRLLANDVARLKTTGKALYSCMLKEDGGVIDDLIVYHIDKRYYRMVVNAAATEKNLAWIQSQLDRGVEMIPRRDLAMIAIQGPCARDRVMQAMPGGGAAIAGELEVFTGAFYGEWFIARTGYTGEDGFEIMLPENEVVDFWNTLLDVGIKPCGLGARDTLRLEAGMNLYGLDMDESTSPLESGLGWTIAWEPAERDFIGRDVLYRQKLNSVRKRFVGILLRDKGVMRSRQKVITVEGEGELTSGGFSPTLGCSIGFARLPMGDSKRCQVESRGRYLQALIVEPPFVRNGQPCADVQRSFLEA